MEIACHGIFRRPHQKGPDAASGDYCGTEAEKDRAALKSNRRRSPSSYFAYHRPDEKSPDDPVFGRDCRYSFGQPHEHHL